MQYGCIGEHLSHSFSKEIHNLLTDYLYQLKEIPMGQLDTFMTARNFKAINVTIPYKQAVMDYLTEVEPTAATIGAVNTIVNRDGQLYGYNTDFGGMQDLILRTGIDMQGKKVLILGTGGTSKTALAVARHMGATSVFRVSRSQKPGVLTYSDVKKDHLDAQVLINTTPCGMFPNLEEPAIDPALFPGLQGVVDVVYNPLRTEFVRKAQKMGVPAAGGLYMLVRQAVLASEIFLGKTYPDGTTEKIYKTILSNKENIVLTGMPGSGKTTVGQLLAKKMGKAFVDTDALIQEKTGLSPARIITEQGQSVFRDAESKVIADISSQTGLVIATGGGVVLRSENMDALQANGKIFFLDRPVTQLLPTDDRPLSSTNEAILQRYHERYAIYVSTADVVVPNEDSPDAAVHQIERSFLK